LHQRPISAILDFRGPITGSLKSPGTTSYRSSINSRHHSSKLLSFRENSAFLRQTDEQNGQHRCSKQLSRAAA